MRHHGARCGWVDYARLLHLVMQRPGTARELSEVFGLGLENVRKLLRVMCDHGLVCEVAHRCVGINGITEVVWGFFGPPVPRRKAVARTERSPNAESFCRVVSTLMCRRSSVAQLSAIAGVWPDRLRPLLEAMSPTGLRLVHIQHWSKFANRGGSPTPLWRWGVNKPNATRPPPLPNSEYDRRRHEKDRRRKQFLDGIKAKAEILFLTAGRPWPAPTKAKKAERTS